MQHKIENLMRNFANTNFSGANHPFATSARPTKVGGFFSQLSQTHLESLFTTSTWTESAIAHDLGHCRRSDGNRGIDPGQVCALNALQRRYIEQR